MESYKRKIKRRIALLSLLPLFGLAVSLCWHFLGDRIPQPDYLAGFQSGILTVLGMSGAAAGIRYAVIVRDEKKLRRTYNQENDERIRAIRAKAGLPFALITSVVMIAVGIIAGYFNFTVFCTLIAAAVAQMLLSCVIKQIYLKKM